MHWRRHKRSPVVSVTALQTEVRWRDCFEHLRSSVLLLVLIYEGRDDSRRRLEVLVDD